MIPKPDQFHLVTKNLAVKPWLTGVFSKRMPLILITALILFSNFAITNFINYQSSIETMRQDLIRERLPQTTQNISLEIKLEILPLVIASSQLADDLYIRQWLQNGEPDKDTVVAYLKSIRVNKQASTCYFVSDKSRLYYNQNGYFPINEKQKGAAWYFHFRASGKDFELNNSINTDMDNLPTVFINNRVEDSQGRFIGATGLGMDMTSIPKILARYKDSKSRNIYFADAEGQILVRSKAAIFKGNSLYELPVPKKTIDNLLANNTNVISYRVDSANILVSVRYLPELHWWILIEQDEKAAMTQIRGLASTNLVINLVAALLTLLLLFWAITHFHAQLEEMASTDKLTGASNRQIFEYALQQAMARFLRNGQVFSVLMLDLDYFKKVNDTLGHLAGDEVLIQTAAIIRRIIRKSDDLSRWGGEEFVVLAYGCDLEQASALAQKIRAGLEAARLALLPDGDPITASIGVSEVRKGDSGDSLLNRADEAMYQAKENGRNRVCSR